MFNLSGLAGVLIRLLFHIKGLSFTMVQKWIFNIDFETFNFSPYVPRVSEAIFLTVNV